MEEKILKLNKLLGNKNCFKNQRNFKLIINLLNDVELLLPFNNNYVIVLTTDEGKSYIPLFTDKKQIKNIEYTRLDKVKLEVVINDIYKKSDYYAISINPSTHDFIMNEKVINIYCVLSKI